MPSVALGQPHRRGYPSPTESLAYAALALALTWSTTISIGVSAANTYWPAASS